MTVVVILWMFTDMSCLCLDCKGDPCSGKKKPSRTVWTCWCLAASCQQTEPHIILQTSASGLQWAFNQPHLCQEQTHWFTLQNTLHSLVWPTTFYHCFLLFCLICSMSLLLNVCPKKVFLCALCEVRGTGACWCCKSRKLVIVVWLADLACNLGHKWPYES